MTIYIILTESRDGEAGILSAHTTHEAARQAVWNWVDKHHGDREGAYEEYDCEMCDGDFSDEEESLTIVEQELEET